MKKRTFWFAAMTIALLAAGWSSRQHRLAEESALSRADGTIQRFVASNCVRGRRGGTSCTTFPIVAFQDVSGDQHTFRSSVGYSLTKLREGQSVVVAYDAFDPSRSARILGYGLPQEALWFIVAALGLALTVCSAFVDRGQRPNNSFKPKPLRGSA